MMSFSASLHRLANPTRFLRLANRVIPWSAGIAILCLAAGLYFALIGSPPDYQQGDTVRIMYVHVPSAWVGMFAYALLAVSSAAALIWRHPLAELVARAAAPVGACFTALCLITGSLWGKPEWGTWWAWDARLTSMLVLFFLYLGYMALANAFDDPVRGGRAASILGLAGVVDLPIVKFSVDWWNTLHQPPSISVIGMPSIDPSMLLPLLLMIAGFTAYFVTVLLLLVKSGIAGAKLQALEFARMDNIGGALPEGAE